jgi:hypothetical protein
MLVRLVEVIEPKQKEFLTPVSAGVFSFLFLQFQIVPQSKLKVKKNSLK